MRDIKKNKIKLKNIIKLGDSLKCIKKTVTSLEIDSNNHDIEAKKQDYTTIDAKNIISLL